MPFTDFFEHAIDSKQRLAIPSRHRSERDRLAGAGGSGEAGRVWVAVPWKDHLRLYPESTFGKLAEQQQTALFAGKSRSSLNAAFFGLSSNLEEDSAGRVGLPKRLIDATGLPAEVVVVGVLDHLEIRPRAAWMARLEQMQREMIEQIDAMS